MTWRRAIGYWILAAGLFVADHFFWRSAPAPVPLAQTARLQRLRSFTIENGGERIRAENVDGVWRLVAPPVSVPGDLIDAVAESFTVLSQAEVVAEVVEGNQFALDPPRL